MSPEQIALINTVAYILDKIGSWPIGVILFVVIVGPWIFMFVLERGQEQRFQATKEMYENNVKLVEGYEKMAENQQDLIIMNTQTMQGMLDSIKSNLFCPIVRQGTEKKEIGP